MQEIDSLLSKISSRDFNKFFNSLSIVASFGKKANKESLLKTVYDVFFGKYDDKNSFYININKIASTKEPLSLVEKYYTLKKFASLGFDLDNEINTTGKALFDSCEKGIAPKEYNYSYLENFGVCAHSCNDFFICEPFNHNPLPFKIKASIVEKTAKVTAENDKDALFEGKVQPFNQDLGIAENTNPALPNPQELTDQETPVNVDYEGTPSVENENDGGQEETLPLERNVHAGLTFVEKDGLYDVIDCKGAEVKKGLKLEAALNLIALTEDEKVDIKDQKELEETFMDASDERGAKEKREHKDLQEVGANTGVETEVKEKEDRASNFSSVDFFDMFRKLDENTANEVLEKIREKVSGESGAEAYNFLLKVKDNNWDFSKTYKETADGQSESEFESERKEQSKKLARTIEKVIEEDAELSQMLNYKDYMNKKENKTASLNVKATVVDDLTFTADVSDLEVELNFDKDQYANVFEKLKEKYPELVNARDLEIYDVNGSGSIKWGLDIEAKSWGLQTLKLVAFPATITLFFNIHYFETEEDEINSDDTDGIFKLDLNLTDIDVDTDFSLGSSSDVFVNKIEIFDFESATLYA